MALSFDQHFPLAAAFLEEVLLSAEGRAFLEASEARLQGSTEMAQSLGGNFSPSLLRRSFAMRPRLCIRGAHVPNI